METGSPKPLQRVLSEEMTRMHTHQTPGIYMSERQSDDISEWLVDILGAAGTLYEGEKFQLHFKFPDDYPFKPSKVQFVGPNIPLNPHVYSNGHICLSILTKEWAPVLNVQGVCLSILSMLSSCDKKELPPDNDYYLRMLDTNLLRTRIKNRKDRLPENIALKKRSWNEWEKRAQTMVLFLIASKENKEDDETKGAILRACGGDIVLDGYSAKYGPEEKPKFEDVVKELGPEFADGESEHHLSHVFRKRVQRPGETAAEWITDLRLKVKVCNYEEMADRMVRDQMIYGVANEDTRRELLEESVLSAEKAVSICLAMESSRTQLAAFGSAGAQQSASFKQIRIESSLPGERVIMETGSPTPLQVLLSEEMIRMHTHQTPGIYMNERQSDDISEWLVDILGAAGTLYEGEKFQLHFKFPDDYPFKPPEVQFVCPNIPLNPHVYSNGHICLSILTKEWAPVLNVQGVCLSILSMLSSCKKKELPPDNDYYLRMLRTNLLRKRIRKGKDRLPQNIALKKRSWDEWKKFIARVKLFLTATKRNKENDETKVAILLACGGDIVLDEYSAKYGPEEKPKFEDVVKELGPKFADGESEHHLSHVFRERVQRPGETAAEWITDLRLKVKMCNYEEMADRMMRDQIIYGVANEETRRELLKESVLSGEEAIRICLAMESSTTQLATFGSAEARQSTRREEDPAKEEKYLKKLEHWPSLRRLVTTNRGSFQDGASRRHDVFNWAKFERKVDRLQSKRFGGCRNCGYNQQPAGNCAARGRSCMDCGRPNHFATMCKKDALRDHSVTEDELYQEWARTIGTEDERMVLNSLRVEESANPKESIRFQVDCGATCNVIPKKIIPNARVDVRRQPFITAYNGTPIRTLGTTVLKVRNGKTGKTDRLRCLVVDQEYQPIIGRFSAERLGLVHGSWFYAILVFSCELALYEFEVDTVMSGNQ